MCNKCADDSFTPITYRELIEALKGLDPEMLDQSATVYLSETDEYVGIQGVGVTKESDVLDENHIVFFVPF